MPATTITIDSAQRNGLYELVRNFAMRERIFPTVVRRAARRRPQRVGAAQFPAHPQR